MASYTIQEDDFEMIDTPNVEIPIRSFDSCSDPFCQKSHVSWEIERASERAIEPLIAVMQATAKELQSNVPIFHTCPGAWNDFIDERSSTFIRNTIFENFTSGLPEQYRRTMNCNTCKKFLRQYGDLVVVGDEGEVIPLMWPQDISNVPQYYKQAVENVLQLFHRAVVGDEFSINTKTIGTPHTGKWNHMSIVMDPFALTRPTKSQDTQTSRVMLERILEDNSPEVIARVYHLITSNQLPYSTSHKPPVEYLKNTLEKLGAHGITFPVSKDPIKGRNLITKYARTAFPGCLSSLRGGLLGYLFECVREDQNFDTLKSNWIMKADPLHYLRPIAAPTIGNIESAEKIFAKLGYTTRDLERVYLTIDQVPTKAILWSPESLNYNPESSNSVAGSFPKLFTHLLPTSDMSKTARRKYDGAPLQDISFRQFTLKILPTASKVDLLPNTPMAPYFFTTGKPNTKPVMAFHKEGSHTASWYTWGHSGLPRYANLRSEWTPVTSIISFPHMWDEFSSARSALDDEFEAEVFRFKRHGIRFLFCLEGAEETQNQSLCLFPTLMSGVFHPVRKTVEAFSNKGKIERPVSGAHVGGVSVEKDQSKHNLVVGVQTKEGHLSRYNIVLFD